MILLCPSSHLSFLVVNRGKFHFKTEQASPGTTVVIPTRVTTLKPHLTKLCQAHSSGKVPCLPVAPVLNVGYRKLVLYLPPLTLWQCQKIGRVFSFSCQMNSQRLS